MDFAARRQAERTILYVNAQSPSGPLLVLAPIAALRSSAPQVNPMRRGREGSHSHQAETAPAPSRSPPGGCEWSA